jgi:hypothetical protein
VGQPRHCEEQGDEAIQRGYSAGLLRYAHNDGLVSGERKERQAIEDKTSCLLPIRRGVIRASGEHTFDGREKTAVLKRRKRLSEGVLEWDLIKTAVMEQGLHE